MTLVRTATSDRLTRLRGIQDQVHSIARMVEQDQYCIDVLTRVSAARRALQSVALGLVHDHISLCMTAAAGADSADHEAKLKEASAAIARLVRS